MSTPVYPAWKFFKDLPPPPPVKKEMDIKEEEKPKASPVLFQEQPVKAVSVKLLGVDQKTLGSSAHLEFKCDNGNVCVTSLQVVVVSGSIVKFRLLPFIESLIFTSKERRKTAESIYNKMIELKIVDPEAAYASIHSTFDYDTMFDIIGKATACYIWDYSIYITTDILSQIKEKVLKQNTDHYTRTLQLSLDYNIKQEAKKISSAIKHCKSNLGPDYLQQFSPEKYPELIELRDVLIDFFEQPSAKRQRK